MTEENIGAVLYGVRDLRVESCPAIGSPGPNEVKLETLFCGLCGSDLHLFHHAELGDFRLTTPYILGHEATARVLQIGSKVTQLKVGDIVTTEPAIPCDTCSYCRTGHYNLCPVANHQAKGMPGTDTEKCNGFLQKYFLHPRDFCYKLPDGVDPKVGALCEPLAVISHSAARCNLTFGQRVLVTGAGTMGLLSLLVAKAFGAESVIVADINSERLRVADKLGADHTVLLQKSGAEPFETGKQIKSQCGGAIDVVMECTGVEFCSILAVETCALGGKVVAVGLGPRLINFPLSTASLKELDVIGVCRFDAGSFAQAVKLVHRFKDVLPLITTHVFELKDVNRALQVMQSGDGVKFLIDLQRATL